MISVPRQRATNQNVGLRSVQGYTHLQVAMKGTSHESLFNFIHSHRLCSRCNESSALCQVNTTTQLLCYPTTCTRYAYFSLDAFGTMTNEHRCFANASPPRPLHGPCLHILSKQAMLEDFPIVLPRKSNHLPTTGKYSKQLHRPHGRYESHREVMRWVKRTAPINRRSQAPRSKVMCSGHLIGYPRPFLTRTSDTAAVATSSTPRGWGTLTHVHRRAR